MVTLTEAKSWLQELPTVQGMNPQLHLEAWFSFPELTLT